MANTQLNYTLTLKDLFKKTIQGASNDTKKLDGQMNGLNKTISRVGTGIAAAFSVGAVINFGRAVIDSLKNYEYFSASIRTLMYGDALSAKALEGQLVKLAATSPFSLTDVQEGSKQLLAYGFSAGKIVDNMKMLGDISSGIGAPLSDIVYLYGTLRTQGRAFSKDINQFTMRGINLLPQLAKQFGVAESAVMGLVEKGKVGFKDVEMAFKAMTSEGGQFFGMMDVQSKTVGGQLSNMSDKFEQVKVNIGKSQSGIISFFVDLGLTVTSRVNRVIEDLNRMDEAFKATGKDLNYSIMERFNNWLFMGSTSGIASMFTGGKGKMDMFNRSLQTMYVDDSGKNLTEAYRSQSQLLTLRSNMSKSFSKKDISKLDYERQYALITGALGQVEGNIKLLKSGVQTKKDETNTEAKGGGSVGSSTELSGARPQNINIKVDKLVETMNIQAVDISGGVTEAKALTSKAFLELLNDANQMANR